MRICTIFRSIPSPGGCRGLTSLTIHDMSTLLFPAHAREVHRTIQEERYRRGALRAARVITVSHATRRDIENVLHVPSERIRTIYSAPDPAFIDGDGAGDTDRKVLDRYSIHYPFVLYAGTIRAQKNIPRLIEAFAVLRNDLERPRKSAGISGICALDHHRRRAFALPGGAARRGSYAHGTVGAISRLRAARNTARVLSRRFGFCLSLAVRRLRARAPRSDGLRDSCRRF